MPNKYYVILYRSNQNQMTFPIKAPQNEFTGHMQFAGGYPAIFGGTDVGGGADPTLVQEVDEEGRHTVVYNPPNKHSVMSRQVGGDHYDFYSTTSWARTLVPWGLPTSVAEGEMMGVVTISLDSFTSEDSPNVVIDKLIALSGCPGGTQAQETEFRNSETAAAFVNFIYSVVPEDSDTTKAQTP